MRSLFPRGAEKCTLYLLQALKSMPLETRLPLLKHDAVSAQDAYYLMKDFARATDVSMMIFPDESPVSWHDFLKQENDLFQPDIVLFYGDSSVPETLKESKLVMVVHGLNENDFSCYRENIASVVCVSQAAVPVAKKAGIPEEKITVIRNGVPMPSLCHTPLKVQFSPDCPVNGTVTEVSRETLKIPEDAWVWLFVGSQTPEKGPQDVIAAMARRKRKDEYLVLVGYPNPEHDMIGLSKEYGVWDRCIHTGVVSTLNPFYEIADALIVPSYQESLPMIILEAIAAGLPIVAREVGGIPEILDGKPYGGLFTGMPDFAMETARVVFPNIEGLGTRQVWDWLDNWTADRMAVEYMELFQTLVQDANRAV